MGMGMGDVLLLAIIFPGTAGPWHGSRPIPNHTRAQAHRTQHSKETCVLPFQDVLNLTGSPVVAVLGAQRVFPLVVPHELTRILLISARK